MEKNQASICEILEKQRIFFGTHRAKDVDFRIEQLKKLKSAILAYEGKITEALYNDVHKSKAEAYSTEIGLCLREISYNTKHLKSWVKSLKVRSPIFFPLSKSFVLYEPYGIVLIIAPWNYPFQLIIAPLIGAIAAGNCAVLKPSELSPSTAQVIQDMIEEHFREDYISVIQGDAEVAQKLLEQRFDYILYTGSGFVGKIVMRSAAEHLTPLTLELGSKNPCIVDNDIDLEKTARRVTWGKLVNTGQTCVAPDYLLVHKEVKENLVSRIKENVFEFYGDKIKGSKDYGRIVNEKHFNRLSEYLEEGEIIFGADTDPSELYIAPTLIENMPNDAKVMQEEIFGPILPVIEYSDITEAIRFVNKRPKPLALYIFSNNKGIQKRVLRETSSGGVCINDVVIHVTSLNLPFGGVGESGFGRYHGRASFELFSNKRSVMKQTVLFDLKTRFPPSTEAGFKMVKRLLK
jgi:aldehyde dehydrogenase (NAD+)